MRAYAVLSLLALTACGGSGTPAAAPTTPAPSRTTARPRPTATRKPTPKPTTPSPTPVATTPPPVTGTVVGVSGAVLSPVTDGPPAVAVRPDADCASIFPDLTEVRCGAVKLAGGDALWGYGFDGDSATVRVLTLDRAAKGYVLRYEGRDNGTAWADARAFAAPLTGRGTDGLVVVVRLASGAATYDVLTWFAGGPLVLRAHRGPLTDGRVVASKGTVQEYALVPDGRYAKRTLAWDGRYFRISAPTGVTAAQAPPR